MIRIRLLGEPLLIVGCSVENAAGDEVPGLTLLLQTEPPDLQYWPDQEQRALQVLQRYFDADVLGVVSPPPAVEGVVY